MEAIESFAIDVPSNLTALSPVQWAANELATALLAAGARQMENAALVIDVRTADDEAARQALASAGVTLPDTPESFALLTSGSTLTVLGRDTRGFVYALTELADRVRLSERALPATEFPTVESPTAKIRSIARAFVSEVEDKPWFHDKSHWIAYLDMLATNRFNRFSLTLGIGYDYPYHNVLISDVYLHFPYPYLLDVPGYDIRVAELSEAERQTNLEMLRFIGREAARRGLDFQLGLWTQRYDFDDVPQANYTVLGVTAENHAAYCRDAVAMLLKEVPEITGLTFRIHVEGGIPEGDYDFWRTVFSGIRQCGRPILIDMHAKGLDQTTLDLGLETGLPVSVAPKYLAEHVGLGYNPSAIREREYPPAEAMTNREKLSVGSRRFLRQSYGDMLPADKRWKVVYRVWPGTQRLLGWGDPELAAGYGRAATFAGSDGIEWMEPLTFKGRQGTGIAGGRAGYRDPELATRYDWEKYLLGYRLLGRRSFSPESSADGWRRYTSREYGAAAESLEAAVAAASQILPLVTHAHGPSIANHNYWPEIYTNIPVLGDGNHRPFGDDMDMPVRFGNAPTFDPQMFANAREYAAALVAAQPLRTYTPMDVADWLEQRAQTAETMLAKARSSSDAARPAVRRWLVDVAILAGLGRFFAAKFRASCWAELFLLTHAEEARWPIVEQLRLAREGWRAAAKAADDFYPLDITFGPGPHLRGSWQLRFGEVERELHDARAYRFRDEVTPSVSGDAAKAAFLRLRSRAPVQAGPVSLTVPTYFHPGTEVEIRLPGSETDSVLHYRHVNQGERWQSVAMRPDGTGSRAVIPADYTASPFHLQVYTSSVADGKTTMTPGFTATLSNTPYAVILQRKG